MTQTTKTNAILEKIRQQYQRNQPKPKKEKLSPEQREAFLKKYFNTVTPGEYRFRILPFENELPEAYFHSMKVNGKWTKLYCPKKNDEKECPLCEAEQALKDTGKQEDFVLSRTYQASLFYIVKGIDRKKIEDSVKFWRFNHNYKQQGILDKLMPLFSRSDITDPINGRDLIITATRTTGANNVTYTTISSIIPDDMSRLVEDDVLLKELVNDKLTWKDVYKPKDVEYLQKVVEGKAPYWDDSQKKYITPGGSTKKTLKAIPVDNETLNGNSEDNDVPETKIEETKTKEVISKVSKKLKKQVVEDVFEAAPVSDSFDDGSDPDDLPF